MLRVLYIDDEPDLLDLCKFFLEETGEFTVDTVPSAAAGIAKLNAVSYDAVVSDYQMEGMDGITLLKTLRSQGSTLPFILFTGRGREEVVIEALNNGADFYLQKGTDTEAQFMELAHKIRLAVGKRKAEDLIRETNEYLTNLITNASVPIVVWDIGFRITRFNRAFEKLTGFTEADVIGQDLDILFSAATRAHSLDLTTRTLFGEKWESAEIPIRTVSGETRTVIWNSANIYARDGTTLIATIAQGTDITERKRAEEELKKAYVEITETEEELRQNYEEMAGLQKDLAGREEKYRSLFTNLPEGAVLHEMVYDENRVAVDYRILDANPATLRILGVSPEGIIGKRSREAWGADEPPYLAIYRQVAETGLPVSFETYFPPMNRHFQISAYSPGKGQFVSVFSDITLQKKVEAARRESEEKFHSLFMRMAQGVIYQDGSGAIIDANPAAVKILGLSRDQLQGRASRDPRWRAIHEDGSDYPGDTHPSMVALSTGKESEGMMGVFNPLDSTYHWLLIDAIPQFLPGEEKPFRVVTTFTDITLLRQAEKTILVKDELVHMTGEMAKVGGWEFDPETLEGTWTDEVARIHDMEPSDPTNVGKGMSVYSGESREKIEIAIRDAIHHGTPYDLELEMTSARGIHKWVRTRAYPEVRDGRVVRVRGIFQDITDRKEAELETEKRARELGEAYEQLTATGEELREQYEELGKSQQAYRLQSAFLGTLLDTIPAPVFYKDRDGKYIGCNHEFGKFFGVDRKTIPGKTVSDILPDSVAQACSAADNDVFRNNRPVQYECTIQRTNGSSRDVIFFEAPFLAEEGNPGGLIGIILDITDRKRTEKALRENEARLDLALASAGMGVWQWDVQQDLRTFDPATCHLLGIDPAAFTGRPDEFFARVHPDDRENLRAAMRRSLEENVVYEPEYRVVWPDGSSHFLAARGKVVQDAGGKPVRVNGLLWDITRQKQLAQELRASEEKYRRILDTAEEGIWELDRNYLTTYVNPKLAAMLGYRPGEMIGKGMSQYMLKEDLADHACHMERRKKGYGDFYERRFVKKDGSPAWMLVSATALRDEEGNFDGSFTMLTDITQRKRVEEELRASEMRFRSIIQNATDIIRILDRNGTIIFDSPASEKILGYPPGYTLGKSPFELIHPEDQDRVRNSLKEVYNRESSGHPTEFRVRKADGSYIYVESIGVNLLGVPGVDGVIVTTHPIDERKRSEQALHENQIRLANAMDLSHLVNWEFDLASGMFTFNDRFYTLYGTTAEKEGGYRMSAEEYLRRFIHPDDSSHVAESVRDIAEVADPAFSRQIGHRIIRGDGAIRYIIVRFSVVLGENGRVTKTYGVNQDISEWKAIEDQLKRFNEELEEKVLERAGELQHALEEKTVLLQEIHHRVKNNLQIIVSLIRLQQRKVSDLPARNALLDSESRVRSMALVHEKLYRAEDVAHIHLTDYVNSLVSSISNMYRVDPERVKIVTRLEMISLDIHQAIPLGLVLNELISNAFKYAFPGDRKGEIGISGSFSGDHITITVRDNGVGIPEGFDWKNASTLGLHLVNTLVEQLHGTIIYTPDHGGTAFEVCIPVQEHRGKT